MDQLVLVFGVLFGAVLAEPLSRRTGVSSAVLMTAFGCVLGVLPAVPELRIPPDLILPLVLPPLLHAAARRTSWLEFRANWRAILARAVVLVIVTTAVVTAAFHAMNPEIPLAAAIALGALVAPPDPVAATAMARKLSLPRRLVSVLEGEGLFNDVTAIVIYGVAVHAVVTGQFSSVEAAGEFALSAVVAVAVGMALGWVSSRFLRWLDEATWQVALSLLVPFAAYGLAEVWHGSAVLAVLVCSLYQTDAAADADDAAYRLTGDSVWAVIELLVSGFAFGLIGLELANVLDTVGADWTGLVGQAAVVVAVVVLVRLIWLLITWWIFDKKGRVRIADEPRTWQETIVTWWAGMRGVATIALALALPYTIHDGTAGFPGRNEILFTAFTVVLFTLLVQGPTIGILVRLIGIEEDTQAERRLERQLWTRVLRAELARLKEIAEAQHLPDEFYERLRGRILQRLAAADPEAADEDARAAARQGLQLAGQLRAIQQQVSAAGRSEALAARRDPGMPPGLVDRVMRRLDKRNVPG